MFETYLFKLDHFSTNPGENPNLWNHHLETLSVQQSRIEVFWLCFKSLCLAPLPRSTLKKQLSCILCKSSSWRCFTWRAHHQYSNGGYLVWSLGLWCSSRVFSTWSAQWYAMITNKHITNSHQQPSSIWSISFDYCRRHHHHSSSSSSPSSSSSSSSLS